MRSLYTPRKHTALLHAVNIFTDTYNRGEQQELVTYAGFIAGMITVVLACTETMV